MRHPLVIDMTASLVKTAATDAIQWASEKLEDTYARGTSPIRKPPRIMVATGADEVIEAWSRISDETVPRADDSFVIAQTGADELLVWGSTARGAIYALLEIEDRLTHDAPDPFNFERAMIRSPKAQVRSIARCFSSELEDKPWFYDRESWRKYLDMLVTNRFSRIALTFGMPYNYPYQNGFLSDIYFHFAYPFLVAPDGYDIRVTGLSDSERRDNLETLQFIGQEAERRGLEFHLGLWTHGYDFHDVPKANYQIKGITADNHAPYCRDALHKLLEAVPQVNGVTFRVHIEGGIPEASYDFWSVVFDGIARTGRPIEVDLHAKGVDPEIIRTAIDSGSPVNVSPKYLAEHMGLPYHQAAIRAEESPPDRQVKSAMSFSEGSRRFLRYSYGDLLSRDRDFSVTFRIWPGTQRILLWGDPAMAAGYGALSTLAGAAGVELCEPLSYKGRMGSGLPGGRFNYSDGSLVPQYDWQKYEIFYRIWGRNLHDGGTSHDEWARHLATTCGDAASHAAAALEGIGGVLNIVTQAYGPSASNHTYCPEVYDNLSLINLPGRVPYGYDFKQPGRFGTAPTFDPQLFANPADFAAEAFAGEISHRYNPLHVAQWLDARATAGLAAVSAAEGTSGANLAETRRILIDARILAGIARFFANKFRAGCAWELYLLSGDLDFCEDAKRFYRSAIDHWRTAAHVAEQVYQPDLSYGPQTWLRGSWASRLPAMERDLNDIEAWRIDCPQPLSDDMEARLRAKRMLAHEPVAQAVMPSHLPPQSFVPGEALTLTLNPSPENSSSDWTAPPILHFRRLNQAESWRSTPMEASGGTYSATIEGTYTQSDFELQYYFSAATANGFCLMPGLQNDLSNQPYYVLPGQMGHEI